MIIYVWFTIHNDPTHYGSISLTMAGCSQTVGQTATLLFAIERIAVAIVIYVLFRMQRSSIADGTQVRTEIRLQVFCWLFHVIVWQAFSRVPFLLEWNGGRTPAGNFRYLYFSADLSQLVAYIGEFHCQVFFTVNVRCAHATALL